MTPEERRLDIARSILDSDSFHALMSTPGPLVNGLRPAWFAWRHTRHVDTGNPSAVVWQAPLNSSAPLSSSPAAPNNRPAAPNNRPAAPNISPNPSPNHADSTPAVEFAIWIDGTPYTPAGLVEFIRRNIRREVGDIPPKGDPVLWRFTR